MTKKYSFLLLILLLGALLFPLISWAGEYQTKDGTTIHYEGLVPCGTEETMPCQFCHLFVMLKGIIDFFLLPPTGLVFIIGVLMLVVAGATFIYGTLISPGNPQLVSDAQRIMTSTIVGLVIVFGAWIFVNAFFLLIGVADWTGLQGGWFQIECDIHLPAGYVPPAGNLDFAGTNGDVMNVKQGENFDLGVSFNSATPVSNMNMDLFFSNGLLALKNIIPNTTNSNFKTFLPIKNDGTFDGEKVINKANESGIISFGATCFDFNTGEFSEQTKPIDSLVTLIFEAKNAGTAEIEIDSENSKLMASIGEIANILKIEENKIQVIIE